MGQRLLQPLLFLLIMLCFSIGFLKRAEAEPHPIQDSVMDNPYHDSWECTSSKGEWRCFEMPSLKPELYDDTLSRDQKQEALTYALGWVSLDSDSEKPVNACQGHYYQPSYFNQESSEPLDQALSKLDYNRLQYELRGTARLKGHVEIRQPGRRLHTDEAVIFPDNQGDKKIRRIEAYGHVRLRQPGILLLGTKGVADLNSHQAKIDDITYLIAVKSDWLNQSAWNKNFSGYAYGKASNLQQHDEKHFSLENATYTTCSPIDHTWSISAKKIMLDKEKGRGYATHTILNVKGMPVLYLPYFSFPITQERQSGFLYGEVGFSVDNGVYLTLPYYFNLAPNYDLTVTPHIYAKRSVMFENEFRYLTRYSEGKINASYMKFDQQYGRHRSSINFTDHTQITDQWTTDTEYNYLSDNDYFKDFNENVTAASANALLAPRSFKTRYLYNRLNVETKIETYQLLDETLFLVNRPYKKMPALTMDWSADALLSNPPLNFTVKTEAVNFEKADMGSLSAINGLRSHMNMGFSMPFRRAYGYFIPELHLLGTHYDLSHTTDSQIQRALYQASLDSGLYFERFLRFGARSYTQTLSPRLFYLYTPFKDQNRIPIFSTGLDSLNYTQLFTRNRFTDIDRIGDTNQFALGIDSAVQNETGQTVLNAQLGQLFYLQDRLVHLCTPAGCQINEDPYYQRHSSELMSHIDTYLTQAINVSVDLNYDPYARIVSSQSYQISYQNLLHHHIVNLGYQEKRSAIAQLTPEQLQNGEKAPSLSQITASTAWQLFPEWRVISKWDFALNSSRTIDLFSGVEYSACCWAVRLLWHRYLINTNPNNPAALGGRLTSVPMIQFELKGLGSTNSSKLSRLEQQIPGVTVIKH